MQSDQWSVRRTWLRAAGSKHQQLTLNTAVSVLFLQAASAVRQPAEGEAQVSKFAFEVRRCVPAFLARYNGYTAQAE